VFQSFLAARHGKGPRGRRPLFKVVAALSAADIVTTPAMGEIQATLSKVMRNVTETAGRAPEWAARHFPIR